jgi:hypothetical protein
MECWRKQLYTKFQVSVKDDDCEIFVAKIFMNKIGVDFDIQKKKTWKFMSMIKKLIRRKKYNVDNIESKGITFVHNWCIMMA